ncbi:hypothetical protein AVEN_155979-1, partial [Araneus ventricosus]
TNNQPTKPTNQRKPNVTNVNATNNQTQTTTINQPINNQSTTTTTTHKPYNDLQRLRKPKIVDPPQRGWHPLCFSFARNTRPVTFINRLKIRGSVLIRWQKKSTGGCLCEKRRWI